MAHNFPHVLQCKRESCSSWLNIYFDSKFEPIPELWENIVIFGCTVVVQELTPSITIPLPYSKTLLEIMGGSWNKVTIPLHVAHMSLGDPERSTATAF